MGFGTPSRASGFRPVRTFLVAFSFFAILSTLWALAGPAYSVADESAHATKAIAQVRGQIIGYERDDVRYTVVDLPDEYRYSPNSVCFIYHPETPANCGVEVGDEGTNWFGTWVGTYNPTYYYLVGWPSLILDGPSGIYAMRIASALVGSLFLALASVAALGAIRARWMPLALVTLASPMILYFAGSVNPQGLEVAAAAALWMSLHRLLQTWRDPREVLVGRGALWAIVAASSVVVANVRALGPLWLVLIVVASLIIGGWRPTKSLFTTARSYWWLGAIAVGGLFSVGWTLSGGSLSGQAEASDAPLVGASFLTGAVQVLKTTPAYWFQAVGQFGWLDAAVPSALYTLFCIAMSALVYLAFVATGRRGATVMALLVALAILVPALVQGYSISQTGLIWQGRYGLFLYVAVPLVAALLLSSKAGSRVAFLSGRTTLIVTSLLAVYGIGAYVTVLRRYVVGNATPITEMLSNPQWQPPLTWPVLTILTACVWGAFAAWTYLSTTSLARREARFDEDEADAAESLGLSGAGDSAQFQRV